MQLAGGPRAVQTEAGFMEQPIRLQGTRISWGMALMDSTEKITRKGQMDGMSSNQEEICEIISVREWVDRVLEEKE